MAYNTAEISQLLQKQAALDKALSEAREKETRLALIEIVQKMREYDISLNELMGASLANNHRISSPSIETRTVVRHGAAGGARRNGSLGRTASGSS
ncbi:hypothetical protein AWB78_03954 [Caballeronia calidae]|uniref:H-NS histone family protein n=1 Tax=Caballeronia calidae TaxID=1777139 RepID=A0A158CHG8_9BURK|nr:hypothetical protein AWB78_03954 [Caballeronia calidae]